MADYSSFSDKFSNYLNTIYHLILKLFIFVGILQVLKFEISKVQDFGNFEISPMQGLLHVFALSSGASPGATGTETEDGMFFYFILLSFQPGVTVTSCFLFTKLSGTYNR